MAHQRQASQSSKQVGSMPGRGQVSNVTKSSAEWQGATAPKKLSRAAGEVLSGTRRPGDTNTQISAKAMPLTAGGKASVVRAGVLIGDRQRTNARKGVSGEQRTKASELRGQRKEIRQARKEILSSVKKELSESRQKGEVAYVEQFNRKLEKENVKHSKDPILQKSLEGLVKTHNDAVQQDKRTAWEDDYYSNKGR